jgi:RNA polymerase sigma-70 factor, ECF subfamily
VRKFPRHIGIAFRDGLEYFPLVPMPNLATPESSIVLERAKAGDRSALEKLLSGVAPTLYRLGMRMCKHGADSDEVVQETLLYAATHLGEFDGRASLTTWLYTILRTYCLRARRGKSRQLHLSDDVLRSTASAQPDPEQLVQRNQWLQIIEDELRAIPDEQREVLILRDVEGLTANEVSEVVGVSTDAVKSRLHRARAMLRARLQPRTTAPSPACPDILLAWSQRHEGELHAGDCRLLEAHVNQCPSCAETCDALKSALLACQRVGEAPIPEDVKERVRASVHAAISRVAR